LHADLRPPVAAACVDTSGLSAIGRATRNRLPGAVCRVGARPREAVSD
jgi:hypothetical protein